MIQLPSTIRTTLFNASVEIKPYELFTHESDRLLAIVHRLFNTTCYPAFGRSSQDALNSDIVIYADYAPILLYGPEPIWVVASTITNPGSIGPVLVQGIYRA